MTKTEEPTREKRRIKRLGVSLPARVEGANETNEKWNEMTHTVDISSYGAGFPLRKKLINGQLVRMTLSMPQQMRAFDYMEPQYKVWGVVRDSRANPDDESGESLIVGVGFIGKDPPKSYLANPAQIYDVTQDSDDGTLNLTPNTDGSSKQQRESVDRRHSRFEIPINIVVGVVAPNGEIKDTEETVMENVSLGGASIFSALNVSKGATVQITNNQYKANLKATVRNKRIGEDGIPRLHIEFMNGTFPLPDIDS